jgi:hypothetical protein
MQLLGRPISMLRRHNALQATQVDPNDVVLVHRELGPLTDGTQEARLLRSGRRGVYDLDDGLQWDWAVGGGLRSLRPKAAKVIRIVRAADTVIAGNDEIAEWAASYAEHVVVIPTCVEPSGYSVKDDYALHSPPRLAWVGSRSTERHLLSCRAELTELHRKVGARLFLFGDPSGHLGDLEAMVTRIPWSEPAVSTELRDCDVGLMPVPDGLLERAKCAYKLLQYGAAGLPGVGSPVGVNAEVLDSVTIRGQLLTASDILAMSAEDRRSVGELQRGRTIESFSYSAWARRWESAVFGTTL